MIFFSDKPEKNGPRVEARLRKELGASGPLPFTTDTQPPSSFRPSLGAALGEAFAEKAGAESKARPMYTFRFALAVPRPWEIAVVVENHGGTSVVGAVHYAMPLPAARLAGRAPVVLEDEKTFGRSKFTGDQDACARLNADKALIKRIHRWVRGSFEVGKLKVTGPRLLQIVPEPDGAGARLIATTLPRPRWFGMAAAFDAHAFPLIAEAAEALCK